LTSGGMGDIFITIEIQRVSQDRREKEMTEQITKEQARQMSVEEIKKSAAAITPQYREFNSRRNPDETLKAIYKMASLESEKALFAEHKKNGLMVDEQIERIESEQKALESALQVR
jgi:hypothetical protein